MLSVNAGFLAALAFPQRVTIRADVDKAGVRLYSGLPILGGSVEVDAGSITRRRLTLDLTPRLSTGTYTDRPTLPYSPGDPLGRYEDHGSLETVLETVFSETFPSSRTSLGTVGFTGSAGTTTHVGSGDGGGSAAAGVKDGNQPAGPATATFTKVQTGLTVGWIYRWSMRVKKPYDTPNYTDRVKIGVTGIGSSSIHTLTTSWVEMSYTFTATATTHDLVITGYEDDAAAMSSVFYLDDMSLMNLSVMGDPAEFYEDFTLPRTSLQQAGFTGSAGTNVTGAGSPGRSGGTCAAPYIKAPSPPWDTPGIATATYTKVQTRLTIERTYRWSMWVRVSVLGIDNYTDRVKIGVTGIGETAWHTLTTSWAEISYTFTATATTHSLVITGDETDAAATYSLFYLDDMALTATTGDSVWVPNVVWAPGVPLGHYGQEITLSWGLTTPDGLTEWVPLGVFRIDSAAGSLLGDGVVRVVGVSREAFVADARFTAPYTASSPSCTSLIGTLIHEVLPSVEVVVSASMDRRVPRTTWDEDRWGAITDLAESIAAVVYADPYGRFVIADAPTVTTPPVWTVNAGPGGVLVSADTSSSRAKIYNQVVVRGESPSSDSPPVQGPATDTAATSATRWGDPAAGAFGMVPMFMFLPTVTTVEQAVAVARANLVKHLGAATTLDVSTVPNPALEAGDVIDVIPDPTDPAGSVRRHAVDSFTVPLSPGGEFPIRTRDLRAVT